jgi:hypothetical protein
MALNLTDLDGRECRWERRECINEWVVFFAFIVVEWRIHRIIRRIHDVVGVLIGSSSEW